PDHRQIHGQTRLSLAVRQSARAVFQDVMHAPQCPHALSKMRIKMTMENGVADGAIAVARAISVELRHAAMVTQSALVDFMGKCLARTYGLRIQIRAARI